MFENKIFGFSYKKHQIFCIFAPVKQSKTEYIAKVNRNNRKPNSKFTPFPPYFCNNATIINKIAYVTMTQQEFEARTAVKVNAREFEAIHSVYMASDIEKDEFCAMWCKMNASRVKAAKRAAKRQATMGKLASMVMRNAEWSDTEHYNTIAAPVLTDTEKALLASAGITVVEEPNGKGFLRYKRFGELRQEIHELLKTA